MGPTNDFNKIRNMSVFMRENACLIITILLAHIHLKMRKNLIKKFLNENTTTFKNCDLFSANAFYFHALSLFIDT